ncbi:MAG: protein translocase subunit SecD [Planctomycetota bacterium]|nr:protein translocase subunit SecD [Planctomycetota bacterium]
MSSFLDLANVNFLLGEEDAMSSWSKLGLLLCMAAVAVACYFVAKRIAERGQRPEAVVQWTLGLGLVSLTALVTYWTGWIVALWPLWAVVAAGVLAYVLAYKLQEIVGVRQASWRFAFALAVAAASALLVPHEAFKKAAELDASVASSEETAEEEATEEESAEEAGEEEATEEESAEEAGGQLTAAQYASVVTVAVLLLAFCLPYLLAKVLGERLRAPEYVWRATFILFTVFLAAFIVWDKPDEFGVGWPPKYGVDLQGGVNLIYEFEVDADEGGAASGRGMSRSDIQKTLVQQLSRRINPSGTSDIVVRPYGTAQVEIIVPEVNQDEVEVIKKLITTAGALEFRIVANQHKHALLFSSFAQADSNKQGDSVYDPEATGEDREELGRWVRVAREGSDVEGERGAFKYNPIGDLIRDIDNREILDDLVSTSEDQLAAELESRGIRDIEVLVYTGSDDPLVTGEGLGMVSAGYENLDPIVNFNLKAGQASSKFSTLTYRNKPNVEEDEFNKLGILLDGELLSAPRIQSQINGRGQITGRFTQEEVDFLVEILRAGKLSTVLQEEPISENTMGAELGQSTINKGKQAIVGSLICVLIFVAVYYQFAGIVACLALVLNLLLVVAFMIMIKAAFTLPGMAGLILTVGMSVDANVLIFERIREELARGARLRMAIRNGFSRATTTIVDANLTTLITAIVLYVIGTDQIRGFAVTLILGILMSMYTAIFCSRVVFELAERGRRLTKLRMMRIVGETKIDFVGKRMIAMVLSIVIIGAGLTGVAMRGKDIFDIDFLGGTALTLQLKEALDADQMDEKCTNAFKKDGSENSYGFTLNSLKLKGTDDNTVWKIVTDVPKSKDLQDKVIEAFEGDLLSYSVTVGNWQVAEPSDSPAESAPAKLDSEPSSGANLRESSRPAGPFFVSVSGDDDESSKSAAADDKAADDKAADDKAADDKAATPQEPVTATPGDTPGVGADTTEGSVVGVRESATVKLVFGEAGKKDTDSVGQKINGASLLDKVKEAAANLDEPVALNDADIVLKPLDKDRDPKWTIENGARYQEWQVTLMTDQAVAESVIVKLKTELSSTPIFHSSNTIGGKVAGDTQRLAIFAMLTSLLGIIGYIWIRFQRVVYGLAAVVALVHDVLVTLGAIALSAYAASSLGFLQIESFSISLPVVAAFLTIVGYSLNDTIVVFDRIREVRGKSPDLTSGMINQSINETLSRTVLTSLTTLIVVLILFFFGGQGIHGFAFSLVIGVIVGTYSSIFVASPVLLWLSKARS